MSLNPPIRKNNRKEAVPRTQRHDEQPSRIRRTLPMFCTRKHHTACTQQFCRLLFKGGSSTSKREGSDISIETLCASWSAPQRRRNIIGTALPLDIFARKRGGNDFCFPSIHI
ncbi:hypothetical protein HMPREF9081_0579 [Centipeda periodontii DSM 2778]|uniref:Uncharacterized protein n=1 Tax=Centipeda periodontii DSM 2778 TaxID=888060 RepID=F5RJZ4_9FIRM|nr:hypothetical protein HMPREF9081_0579 [Centipeda periodontii DSM 2778]